MKKGFKDWSQSYKYKACILNKYQVFFFLFFF